MRSGPWSVLANSSERSLAFHALALLGWIRFRLRFGSAPEVLRWSASTARRKVITPASQDAQRRLDAGTIAWMVRAVSRRLPGTTCLHRALATRILLAEHGHESEMKIGVQRDEEGVFRAHAWIEIDGRPIRGSGPVKTYKSFSDIGSVLERSLLWE